MDSIVRFGVTLHVTSLKLLGYYPPEKNSGPYRIYAVVLYSLTMGPLWIFSVLHFLSNRKSDTAVYNSFFMVAMIFYAPKLLPCVKNSSRIRKCFHYFDGTFFKPATPKQEEIRRECTFVCNRNLTLFFVGSMTNMTSFFVHLFAHDELPLGVSLPFTKHQKPALYWMVYVSLCAGIFYAGTASAVIDPLIAGLAYQATAQLKVLKDKLQHFEDESQQFDCSDVIYCRIKNCILHYQAIVDFVEECKKSFSLVAFYQLLESGLIIGFCCLQLSRVQPRDYLVWINYLISLFIQVYFYCYYGTTLAEENKTLTEAIYTTNWYEYNVKFRKALIILMERSKKPMVLSAGNLFDLSLDTFTLILKRSYSFLAILKTYY